MKTKLAEKQKVCSNQVKPQANKVAKFILKLEDFAQYPGDKYLVKKDDRIYDIWYATYSNTLADDDAKHQDQDRDRDDHDHREPDVFPNGEDDAEDHRDRCCNHHRAGEHDEHLDLLHIVGDTRDQ